MMLNPFAPNGPFLYSPKTSESLTNFLYFQWVEKGCIENTWVNRNIHSTILYFYQGKIICVK